MALAPAKGQGLTRACTPPASHCPLFCPFRLSPLPIPATKGRDPAQRPLLPKPGHAKTTDSHSQHPNSTMIPKASACKPQACLNHDQQSLAHVRSIPACTNGSSALRSADPYLQQCAAFLPSLTALNYTLTPSTSRRACRAKRKPPPPPMQAGGRILSLGPNHTPTAHPAQIP